MTQVQTSPSSSTSKAEFQFLPLAQIKKFPYKCHDMLHYAERNGMDNIISWEPDGKGFCVHNHDLFCKKILKVAFNHSNFKSFEKQLRNWSFKTSKVKCNTTIFSHEMFIRGRKSLCVTMKSKNTGYTSIKNQKNTAVLEKLEKMAAIKNAMANTAVSAVPRTTTSMNKKDDPMSQTLLQPHTHAQPPHPHPHPHSLLSTSMDRTALLDSLLGRKNDLASPHSTITTGMSPQRNALAQDLLLMAQAKERAAKAADANNDQAVWNQLQRARQQEQRVLLEHHQQHQLLQQRKSNEELLQAQLRMSNINAVAAISAAQTAQVQQQRHPGGQGHQLADHHERLRRLVASGIHNGTAARIPSKSSINTPPSALLSALRNSSPQNNVPADVSSSSTMGRRDSDITNYLRRRSSMGGDNNSNDANGNKISNSFSTAPSTGAFSTTPGAGAVTNQARMSNSNTNTINVPYTDMNSLQKKDYMSVPTMRQRQQMLQQGRTHEAFDTVISNRLMMLQQQQQQQQHQQHGRLDNTGTKIILEQQRRLQLQQLEQQQKLQQSRSANSPVVEDSKTVLDRVKLLLDRADNEDNNTSARSMAGTTSTGQDLITATNTQNNNPILGSIIDRRHSAPAHHNHSDYMSRRFSAPTVTNNSNTTTINQHNAVNNAVSQSTAGANSISALVELNYKLALEEEKSSQQQQQLQLQQRIYQSQKEQERMAMIQRMIHEEKEEEEKTIRHRIKKQQQKEELKIIQLQNQQLKTQQHESMMLEQLKVEEEKKTMQLLLFAEAKERFNDEQQQISVLAEAEKRFSEEHQRKLLHLQRQQRNPAYSSSSPPSSHLFSPERQYQQQQQQHHHQHQLSILEHELKRKRELQYGAERGSDDVTTLKALLALRGNGS